MYIKVRQNGDAKQECMVEVSKQNKVDILKKAIEKKTGIKEEQQTLIFKGKTLESTVPVLDYQIENNSVIQLFIKAPKENDTKSNEEVDNGFDSETSSEDPDKLLVDTESKYYKVGNFVDVMVEDDGSWYEATIIKIFLKNKASTSSNNDSQCDDTEENDLVFRVRSADHIIPGFETDARFKDIRPRSYFVYKLDQLCPDMIVLVNYNLEHNKSRGSWYNFKVNKISKTNVTGTLLLGNDTAPIEDCSIAFTQEIMRIESPSLLSDIKAEERNLKYNDETKRKYPYSCNTCKDNRKKKCRDCGCKICRGKENWEKIILCDECDAEYHITCLNPPLSKVPSGDWYCPSCKVDDSKITKKGEIVKLSKKRANMASKTTTSTRDWGKGMACAGRTKQCTVVPKDYSGPIPGIDVGTRWKFRIQVSEAGVHRPHVSGIHGSENKGAMSIVLAGGYADDKDNGDEFIYSGSGGRDLSGNKRVNVQTSDQELTRANKALALSCNVPFNEKGAESADWRKGLPIRVVRSAKGRDHSKYCPEEGLRYDGIYKVVKYFPEKGESGFVVFKYWFRRDDPNPAPWEKGGHEYDIIYPDGYLEAQAAKEKEKEKESETKSGKRQKRKNNSNILTDFVSVSKKPKLQYTIPSEVLKLIKKDTNNVKLWDECSEAVKDGKPQFLAKVEELFKCICCLEIAYEPVTTECKHNMCQDCLKRAFKLEIFTCHCCRTELGKDYKIQVNENLSEALKLLFPGYGQST